MQPGQTIAHYTIVSLLGRGGMGEVWRATDTKLGRDVALKLLPAAFADDPERVARFRREAQSLASLQHPHVASIYGLETADGATVLVMELCEGEDLSAIIERGALPVDEVREIGRQIAAGLEAAHEKGIVHRDLKPANVKVAADGQVKILDFGLARAGGGNGDPHESSGETMTVAASVTRPGVVLGTAAYMSPEQARGKAVDKRADVWAFGAILWEMLTGRRLFTGETVSDLLAAVLREDPDWDALPAGLPVELAYLLRRCLDRSRDGRLRDIGEARCLLGNETASSSLWLSATAAAAGPVAADGGGAGRIRTRGGRLWPTVAAVALVALAATWLVGLRTPGADMARSLPYSFTRLTALTGPEVHGSLDPAGAYFVYAARGGDDLDIYLQRTGGLNPINLTADSPADDTHPAISPDGRSIAFTSDRDGGGVYIMGATGETARLLAAGGSYPAWSADGAWIAFSTEPFTDADQRQNVGEIWRVRPDGSESQRISGQYDAVQPAWSPGGERIAFWSVRGESGQRDILTIRPDGTDLRPVTDDSHLDFSPVWSRDGRRLLFLSNRGGSINAWQVVIDETSGEVRGQPQPLTLPAPEVRHLAVAADGSHLVFTAETRTTHIYRAGLDPATGQAVTPLEPVLTSSMHVVNPRISPDGAWLAFAHRERGDNLVLVRTDGTDLRLLLNDGARNRGPSWTPDGRRLLFYSDHSGRYEIWSIRTDGGDARQLSDLGERSLWFPTMSPHLGIVAAFNEHGTHLLAAPSDVGRLGTPDPVPRTDDADRPFFGSSWSRDGRRLAGWTAPSINNQAHSRLAVYDRETATVTMLSDEGEGGWAEPCWLPDDRRIVYVTERAIKLASLDGGTPTTVLEAPRQRTFTSLALAPDGSAIFVLVEGHEADLWVAEMGPGLGGP